MLKCNKDNILKKYTTDLSLCKAKKVQHFDNHKFSVVLPKLIKGLLTRFHGPHALHKKGDITIPQTLSIRNPILIIRLQMAQNDYFFAHNFNCFKWAGNSN